MTPTPKKHPMPFMWHNSYFTKKKSKEKIYNFLSFLQEENFMDNIVDIYLVIFIFGGTNSYIYMTKIDV